ncbi:hypothetical protein AGMMS49959_13680 [Planctomycetales bacterium]|nr:hypothetical protein AGMMS49959_13680 [Planctomycetales bacterium]
MQFQIFEPDIEVNAPTVYAIIDGVGVFTNLSRRYLGQVGIGTVVDKKLVLDMDGWYSQAAWLQAFENIAKQIGDRVLFNIGYSIPRNAEFPAQVTDIDTAIQSIDIAYHCNHRKNGQPLFDAATGVKRDGIGHYGYARVSPTINEIVCVSHNPYPCAFDRGIYLAMARRFQPTARIVHDDAQECRQHGAETCTYRITW